MHKAIKLKQNLKLRCHNNKLWPVKISLWKDGHRWISTGWNKFREENDIKANDTCVFELVLGKGKICEEIKVRVIHGAART